MSAGYDFVLVGSCARALLAQPAPVRKRTLALLEVLADSPFREPDFRETGPAGREYLVVIERDIIVTYWIDHAVKEVRVVQLEWV